MRTPPLTALCTLALAGAALAGGFSGHFDAVETALDQEAQGLLADTTRPARRLRGKIGRALTKFRKPATADSYVKELAKAKAFVVIAAKFLSDDAALMTQVDDAISAVTADMDAKRDALEAGLQAPDLSRRKLRQLQGKLRRADKALGLLDAASRAKKLSLLKRLAQLTKGFEPGQVPTGPTAGATHTWVISALALADAQDGLDLDGDGSGDNAMGELATLFGSVLDDFLTAAIEGGAGVLLVQMWGVEAFTNDADIGVGIVAGTDTDGLPDDNFSGQETFDVLLGLGPDGHPLARGFAGLDGQSVYELGLDAQELNLGDTTLTVGSVRLRGTAAAAAHDGILGFAIPDDALVELIELVTGQPVTLPTRILLNNLLDIDLDGDGSEDAISVALAFTSVAAGINPPPE